MSYEDKKVLVVEDNEMNRMLVTMALAEYDIVPDEAEDGRQAYTMYMDKPEGYYDLILMDMLMPVMGGEEATGMIRGSERADAATIPIIAMTAESDADEIARYPEIGMSGYLEKPMDDEALFSALQQYLGD